ncbi:MAG TPA: hypothetical protein VMM93_11705 [Vicinamibacterales bacterium]|nr:hypothetical protein [Vicinamibacterales bacterium]
MPRIDAAIDRLYQLPAAEFTSARNALVKTAGADAARVRVLEKPNAPAWAVNQVYWRERAVWDRLIAAAADVRAAHRRRLAGKSVEVDAAENAHKAAVRTAADAARAFLDEAGDPATPATIAAVLETLQSLPGKAEPGRLSRPLKPMGLEALAGLVRPAGAFPRPVEAPASRATAPPAKVDRAAEKRVAAAAKKEAEAQKKEAARLDAELKRARAAEKQTTADLARARQALVRAEREHERLSDALQFAEKQRRDAVEAARELDKALGKASQHREALELQIRMLR